MDQIAKTIEDYALIGDCHTAALVHRNGAIEWLCLPQFDSPACFASLLGDSGNGQWRIAPADESAETRRAYREDTLILETEFRAVGGAVRVIDYMPLGEPGSSIVRLVEGLEGEVEMAMGLTIRYDYGRLIPWVSRQANGALTAVAGPHRLSLHTPVEHFGEDLETKSKFTVRAGERLPFTLAYSLSYEEGPPVPDPERALRHTQQWWQAWAARCTYSGPWREAVVRSLLTLKALTFEPTGGIVAAPTTSLPESRGGNRNWDYRFCWLRDATFTLLSLLKAGYVEEADAWRDWVVRAAAGHPAQLQPLYSIVGDSRLDEWEVPWLAGFGDAAPVRVGNAASAQLQLDIFGEVLDALHHARRMDLSSTHASWGLQRVLLDHLSELIDQPDRGIWEVRGPEQYFTHSRVMMWVAFDRGVAAADHFGMEGPVAEWRRLRDWLHEDICQNHFDAEIGAFVQARGSKNLDSATLLIPMVGFLPASDPRVIGTVEAIQRDLMVDGFVCRYNNATTDDGLRSAEGAFLPCSFWLADNLAMQGRHDEARELFQRLLALRNDVGLLAEEYDVEGGFMLGNFPQALSHLALIDTAFNLFESTGPATERPKRAKEA